MAGNLNHFSPKTLSLTLSLKFKSRWSGSIKLKDKVQERSVVRTLVFEPESLKL